MPLDLGAKGKRAGVQTKRVVGGVGCVGGSAPGERQLRRRVGRERHDEAPGDGLAGLVAACAGFLFVCVPGWVGQGWEDGNSACTRVVGGPPPSPSQPLAPQPPSARRPPRKQCEWPHAPRTSSPSTVSSGAAASACSRLRSTRSKAGASSLAESATGTGSGLPPPPAPPAPPAPPTDAAAALSSDAGASAAPFRGCAAPALVKAPKTHASTARRAIEPARAARGARGAAAPRRPGAIVSTLARGASLHSPSRNGPRS